MAARHDILDRRDSLQKPVLLSIGFHAAVALSMVVWTLLPISEVVQFGDPNSLGGSAVSITPVSKIPLPSRSGPRNPVANDTESRVPAAPPNVRRQTRDTVRTEEEAVEIPRRQVKKQAPRRRLRTSPSRASVPKENQVYGSSGAAATSEMFGSTSGGGGGVGVGKGNPFGHRFGYYVGLLREKVAAAWDTSQVDPRLQTAPIVIVIFDIQRNGTASDVRFLQRSGHSTLDYSCQRAIFDASPFPPLPAGFERNSARIEFQFELKR